MPMAVSSTLEYVAKNSDVTHMTSIVLVMASVLVAGTCEGEPRYALL